MAITYTRKVASAVAVNDKISVAQIQSTGARSYMWDTTVDERPTVASVVQVKSPNETVRGADHTGTNNSDGSATGPVKIALTGGKDASSVQNLVLAPNDTVIVSTGTP